MDSRPPPPVIPVDIPSDDSPFLPRRKKRVVVAEDHGGGGGGRPSPPAPPLLVVLDDDPTPQKRPNGDRTPPFVPETPMTAPSGPSLDSDGASFVRCSLARSSHHHHSEGARLPSSNKFSGLISLDSDDEGSEGGSWGESPKARVGDHETNSTRSSGAIRTRSEVGSGNVCGSIGSLAPCSAFDSGFEEEDNSTSFGRNDDRSFPGMASCVQIVEDSPLPLGGGYGGCFSEDDIISQSLVQSDRDREDIMLEQLDEKKKQGGKCVAVSADKRRRKDEMLARKKQLNEEKKHLNEERKRKRQEDKLAKEALKAEVAEMKKLQKEKEKWEKGKFALKSIVAEIDSKVVETGSVGGHLLTRFAEKGLSFRITSNPIKGSILWKMSVPDKIFQLSLMGSKVQYVLLVYEADEFCNLVTEGTLLDHVCQVQQHYPSFTICYLTNKLMSYINKREQSQYKNPSNVNYWKRPPVEEVLSKLSTHFKRVHSRQCIDEAEVADHLVGLTSSLATCQFRKKLSRLSVNANGGSLIPKDFVDKNLIKKSVWLKTLLAIPKVQPRFAIAIGKKYPTMRSLLNVYMDPNRSVHEKEFLLKDLKIEGLLGSEDRRLGEVCSKRVYRVLMAQSGGIKTDDVEDGADFF